MASTLAAAGGIIGKALFTKSVNELIEFLSKKTGNKIKQWNTERKIETLYQKIHKVRKVKTIWQIDKAVDLKSFYVDSNFLIDEERKTVNCIEDFGIKGNILIEGIAGQGKSIFLRYLCAEELIRGNYIPIFVELRRIDQIHSLRDRIFTAFKALDLPMDDALFEGLAASGKIIILFDAFDEVPEELKLSVITDIEDLASNYENLKLIITTRPEQSIKTSSLFTVAKLDNLITDEYAQVIRKLSQGKKWAESLLIHLKEKAAHIEELLCTPLMATLLILQYKSYKKLPDSLSEFYDTLFLALLQRHDGTKPGFRRQRRCPLDDTQYRHVFETICILAKKSNQQIYNQKTIYKITEEAIKNCNVEANPADFIEDIIKITCLILREGVEHRFIHKTVQEYYTASYIQRKPESWREKLYTRIKIKKIHIHWNQELQFLSEIDKYHYNKFYFLPTAIEFFGITIDDLKVGHKPSILSVSKEQLKDLIVGVHGFPPRFSFYVPKQNFFADNFTRLMIDPFTRYNHPPDILSKNIVDYSEKIITEFPQAHFIEGIERKNKLSGKFVRIKFSDLIDKLPYINEILASCQNYFDELFEEASLMLISMQDADDESLLEGLV